MRIKLTALSILLFASVGWSLNSNVTFNNLSACKSAYKLSGNADAADELAQDKFCATRVPSLAGTGAVGTATAPSSLEVCINIKLQNLLVKTPDLNAIAQQNAKDQFRAVCAREQATRDQQSANVNAQQAQIAAQQAQAQAAADAKAAAKSGGGAGKGGGDKDPDFGKIIGDFAKFAGVNPKSVGTEIGRKLAGDKPAAPAAAKPAAATKPTEEPKPDTGEAKPAEAAKEVPVTEADRKAVAGSGSTPEQRAAEAKADEDKFKASQDGKGTTADGAPAATPATETPKPIVQDDVTGVDKAVADQAKSKAESTPAAAPDRAPDAPTTTKADTTSKDEVDGGIATNQDGSLKTAAQIDEDLKKPVPAEPVAGASEAQAADAALKPAETDPKAGCDAEFGCKGDFDKAVADAKERDPSIGEPLSPEADAKAGEDLAQQLSTSEAGQAADAELGSSVTDASSSFQANPEASDAIKKLSEPNAATDPKTIITVSADAAEQKIAATFQIMAPMFEAMSAATMSRSTKALEGPYNKIHKYMTQAKKECTKATEASDKMCKKETNPTQAKVAAAAKAIGPALKGIDSVTKLLTLTADAAKLSSAGLGKANAECAKEKTKCDTTCEKASKEVDEILADIKKFQGEFQGELAEKMSECEAAEVTPPFCHAVYPAFNTVSSGIPQVTQALTGEKTPTPLGTVQSLVLKCKVEHAMDIAGVAKLMQDLLKSANSAKDSAKKLSSGSGAGNVKIATYCEQPDNKTTQFCTCQKNPLGKDCPGAVANAIDNAKKKAEIAGKDIKSSGGAGAGFASGFKPTTALGAGINGKVGSLNTSKDAKNTSGFAGGKSGFGGGVGGGVVAGKSSGFGSGAGGSGLSSSSRDPASSEKGNNAPKKFSFGSFASSGGGGGRGGGGGGSAKANGVLLKKQLDAIKRQIASDKIAAEVSSASGKTNWDKIREMYTIQSRSLIIGQ